MMKTRLKCLIYNNGADVLINNLNNQNIIFMEKQKDLTEKTFQSVRVDEFFLFFEYSTRFWHYRQLDHFLYGCKKYFGCSLSQKYHFCWEAGVELQQ